MELVTTFSYSGNLGADGSGSYGAFTFSFSGTATSSGTTVTVPWRGWAKSVCGAGDPSVNHLIMAPAELVLSSLFFLFALSHPPPPQVSTCPMPTFFVT